MVGKPGICPCFFFFLAGGGGGGAVEGMTCNSSKPDSILLI